MNLSWSEIPLSNKTFFRLKTNTFSGSELSLVLEPDYILPKAKRRNCLSRFKRDTEYVSDEVQITPKTKIRTKYYLLQVLRAGTDLRRDEFSKAETMNSSQTHIPLPCNSELTRELKVNAVGEGKANCAVLHPAILFLNYFTQQLLFLSLLQLHVVDMAVSFGQGSFRQSHQKTEVQKKKKTDLSTDTAINN